MLLNSQAKCVPQIPVMFTLADISSALMHYITLFVCPEAVPSLLPETRTVLHINGLLSWLKRFPAFLEHFEKFVTLFTKFCHWALTWATSV